MVLRGRFILVVIQNPSATYSYTIGTGGEGGAHTGYIPDTVDELRAAMENEHPDTEYTDNELQNMINTYENSGWTGSPNPGSAGTASTFGSYSSADGVAQTVYEPITDQFFCREWLCWNPWWQRWSETDSDKREHSTGQPMVRM